MNVYIYSDESGVFDQVHNDFFVFGGLILLGSKAKEYWSRRYASAEKIIRNKKHLEKDHEIKASSITNNEKGKLFRSLNHCYKFGAIIYQKKVLPNVFQNKKEKQRYLDYSYRIAVKYALQNLIKETILMPHEVERLFFYIDEHTAATNNCYELKEKLEQEFRYGTYTYNYSAFFPPLFPDLKDVQLETCNSKSKRLIRAADIIANKLLYLCHENKQNDWPAIQNFTLTQFP